MSVSDLIQVAAKVSGIPGLDTSVALLHTIVNHAENVKIYRQQCKDLCNRCVTLLNAVGDSTSGMGDDEAVRAADEVEATISRIHLRMKKWAGLSFVRSFVSQGEIKDGIDSSYRDLEICSMKYNIMIGADLSRGQKEMVAIQERDHAELRENLGLILKNQDDLKAILEMKPPIVEGLMQTIQEELRMPDLRSTEEQPLRQGLWELHRQSDLLPPLIDLTADVVKTSNDPVFCGAFNDIYPGMWLDEERVALRLPRALVNAPDSQSKRFLKEVEIWRHLQHPNVTRLYGIAYFGGHVYSVSKWMDNGNAITYIVSNPNVDRLKIMYEVASGMEYLHSHKIVHGDLRGANVLIAQSGKACLSDFGLSKFLEQVGQGTQSSPAGANPYRWLAPELIRSDSGGQQTVSTWSDIWAFAMLCLELMTGEAPFSNIVRDINVAFEVVEGRLPPRPGPEAMSRGLSDELWALMLRCWKKRPEARPPMTEIRAVLRQLRQGNSRASFSGTSLRDPPTVLTNSPSRFDKALPQVSPTTGFSNSRARASSERTGVTPNTKRPATAPGPAPGNSLGLFSSVRVAPSRSYSTKTNGIATVNEQKEIRNGPNRFQTLPLSTTKPRPLQLDPPPQDADEDEDWSALIYGVAMSNATIPNQTSTIYTKGVAQTASVIEANHVSLPAPIPRPEEPPAAVEDLIDLTGPSSLPSNFPTPSAPSLAGPSTASFKRVPSQQSVQTTSLDLAINDPTRLLHLGRDGAIEAGTLEGLVDRLLTDSREFMKDVEYRKVFLSTYFAFTSAEIVYNALVRRFRDVEQNTRLAPEDRVAMRYNVLLVMKQWLTSRHAQVNINVLSQMKDFCISVRSSTIMIDLARDVVTKIDERIRTLQDSHLLSPTLSSPGLGIVPRAADISPQDLAIALTILEGDRFSRIIPADYISYFRRIPVQNNVDTARSTNTTIVNWVKKSILRSNDVGNRGEHLKFFVNTAEECRKLFNFASTAAIVEALDSTAVTRLRLTRDRLKETKNMDQLLRKLCSLRDRAHNYRVYRTALGESRKACIPWLAVHLDDMGSVYRTSPVTEIESRPLINFGRCIKLHSRIEEMDRYKPPTFVGHRESGPLTYLEDQLRGVPMHPRTAEALEARAVELEFQENRMRNLRLPQLKSVGFRT